MLLSVKRMLLCWILFSISLTSCDLESKKQYQPEVLDLNNPIVYSLFGHELIPPTFTVNEQQKKDSLLGIAKKQYKLDSANETNIIWYGRRLAYLYKYVDAIRVYSKGLDIFPNSYRLLRHRGHRYISMRKFDLAIADLEAASHLVENRPLEIEPDGIPNKINKPLSNTHFNIWYHLGLAYYLKGDLQSAAKSYEKCLRYAMNDDLICAVVDWLYMTYQELEEGERAKKLLFLVTEDMTIVENDAYYKRILMYQGKRSPDSLLTVSAYNSDKALALATQGFGLGNWYRLQGDVEKAEEVFKEVVKGESWSAFGFIAAEVVLNKKE